VLYSFVRHEAEPEQAPDRRLSLLASSVQSVTSDSYDNRVLRTTYKCIPPTSQLILVWVHPDNLMEVKTFILRRLPLLVYDSEPRSKPSSRHNPDPTITNLYFDDSAFSSYMNKLERSSQATSLRLRWYGKLNEQSEVAFEKKVSNFLENAEDVESRITIKRKYVKDFLEGNYSMEKTIRKMRDGAKNEGEIKSYQEPIKEIQSMIKEGLSPGTSLVMYLT
jgi:SPX domain protein involved in polyphosphate accumulation